MPIDRTLAEDLARKLVEIYAALEADITRDLGRRLVQGIDRPDWAGEKLASINDLRNALQRLLNKVDRDATAVAAQQLVLAFARGGNAALEEIAAAGGLTEQMLAAIRASLPGAEAINAMVWTLMSTLRGTHVQVLRWGLDVYRDVIASTLPYALAGTATRLGIAQRAYDRFLSRGVTGFTDKAGRNWKLSSYVEMATRTGLAQAAVQGHFDRLEQAGIDLVQVSNSPQECGKCRPWEGKILYRDAGGGGRGIVSLPHATEDGVTVSVHVAGTVAEAILAGLMHPNCRHSFRGYFPGVTKLSALTNTADPEGDKARQKQRAIERAIREAKTQAGAALTPAAAQGHEADVRALQAQMRDHLKANPVLRRLPYREQIGAGNIAPAARASVTASPRAPEETPATPAASVPSPTRTDRPAPAPPKRTPGQRVAALAAQQPADTRPLTGGITSQTDLLTYPDGSRLVRKINTGKLIDDDQSRDMTDAELLGAAVLDAVGLRAPGVHKTGPAEVFMEFIDGTVGAELVTDPFQPAPAEIVESTDGRLLGLADLLMTNLDRNLGNWILDTDGRVVGIDEGFAFAENTITSSPFAAYLLDENTASGIPVIAASNDLTPADAARLGDRLTALRPLFEQHNRGAWHAAMMDVHASLARGAHGTTDRIT